ncbi:phosphoribosylformylglycinamidine cyclo-ligase [Aerococcus sp. 1KP-2016]|uniref:phosphoribosylformylglycinamidine cyclo-ligase n=1 Tax=Aerococcus sp. 1KP-2016 TaxID=1981982 RepID=UPI000B9843B5|nr:phosphoribosylformylglycinamidine cyclo-ligase [Aerococcus sp. 1KP-2016]OYQ68242.1 phosphoribosylformylglycinamidine cyclo-ligase [Aerococcus sp. 1KP-2016]
MSNAYQASGVDIEKGYEAVERMKKHVARTQRPEVLNQLGSFGALFKLDMTKYSNPVLVSGTDGVGTKILLAQEAQKYDTVGIDCVAMCANDILAQGAQPLFFLDYLAVGHNQPATIEQIVAGVAEGCVQAGAALVGGETAEMPDLYHNEEFDLAGFCVGVADQDKLLDGSRVKAGDVLIGLPSSGIHSNGYSLVRKVFFKDNSVPFNTVLRDGKTLIDHLLTPTKIYVQDVMPFVEAGKINGIAHITGGGFYENVPRMYGDNLSAQIDLDAWQVPCIFKEIQSLGQLDQMDLYNVFNMGIGMVLAVDATEVEAILAGIDGALIIGQMTERQASDANVQLIRKSGV